MGVAFHLACYVVACLSGVVVLWCRAGKSLALLPKCAGIFESTTSVAYGESARPHLPGPPAPHVLTTSVPLLTQAHLRTQ